MDDGKLDRIIFLLEQLIEEKPRKRTGRPPAAPRAFTPEDRQRRLLEIVAKQGFVSWSTLQQLSNYKAKDIEEAMALPLPPDFQIWKRRPTCRGRVGRYVLHRTDENRSKFYNFLDRNLVLADVIRCGNRDAAAGQAVDVPLPDDAVPVGKPKKRKPSKAELEYHWGHPSAGTALGRITGMEVSDDY